MMIHILPGGSNFFICRCRGGPTFILAGTGGVQVRDTKIRKKYPTPPLGVLRPRRPRLPLSKPNSS